MTLFDLSFNYSHLFQIDVENRPQIVTARAPKRNWLSILHEHPFKFAAYIYRTVGVQILIDLSLGVGSKSLDWSKSVSGKCHKLLSSISYISKNIF